MKQLPINSNDGFLHLEDLPQNCIFNKVVTGCGGTTIALKNKRDYVIAVPTVELIVNKIKRDSSGVGVAKFTDGTSVEVFGLFGCFDYQTKKELKDYISTHRTRKIICTYDKVPYLASYIDTKQFQLLVDEYHTLLKAYSYRDKAINGIFDCYKSYKSVCFMSATPINPDFKPSALEALPEITAVWDDTDSMIVNLQYSNKPYVSVANIISEYKTRGYLEVNGNRSYEAFFFINSVKDIVKIIEHCNLEPEEVRIICANKEDNRKKLGRFQIENSNCPNKRFTFLTCKSFEGVDYESDSAICFVVSTSSNPHTQASIDTDIPQIAGRIRTQNNPFRKMIIHIFNRTYKDLNLDVTFEEMKNTVDDEIKAASTLTELFNNAPDTQKKVLAKSFNNKYLTFKDGKCIFYDTLPKLELYNYMINQIIYKNGLAVRKEYNKNGIITTAVEYTSENETLEAINKASKKSSFKDMYLAALEAKCNKFQLVAHCEDSLVKKAIENLTPEEVRSVRYTRKGVEELLLSKNSRLNQATKVIKLLKSNIHYNEFIKNDKLTSILASVYSQLGIDKKAKASDIKMYFDVKDDVKKIDGKAVRGYYILREKIVVR